MKHMFVGIISMLKVINPILNIIALFYAVSLFRVIMKFVTLFEEDIKYMKKKVMFLETEFYKSKDQKYYSELVKHLEGKQDE